MAANSSFRGAAMESRSKDTPYSRKQKSLGLLCTNFLNLYNREGVETIGLDDAASRLGVERRRIYDIVNILESVGILARKAKCQYSWRGFGGVPKALEDLKKEGLGETGVAADTSCSEKVSEDEDDEVICYSRFSSQNKSDSCSLAPSKSFESRKDKSLGLLTQKFVKLFLCTNMDVISLDHAAKLLFGGGHYSSMTDRTKVRRLYDIANVLCSMNFIEKTHHPETRKTAFTWLGLNGKPANGTADSPALNESKKRVFGIDITNTSSKMLKVEEALFPLKQHSPIRIKDDKENEVERTLKVVNSYQFGPFAPANLLKVGTSHEEKRKQVVD